MRVNVLVKPGAKKGPDVVPSSDGIVVWLNEKAHDGEANSALIKVLADYFDTSKSCVVIKSGAKSRKKVVEIIGK